MVGNPPPDTSASRRRFLVSLGWLLALLAVPFQAAFGLFRRPGSRSHPAADPAPVPLSGVRCPVWHPRASGFHDDAGLTVRRDLGPGVCRETVLRDAEARLWCLCGGVRSEAELARVLVEENGLTAEQADAAVRAFLAPLYRDGYLLLADDPHLAQLMSHEVEAEPGFREFPCRRPATS